MLGITTADAIAFGSMIAAAMAAYAGLLKGSQAKKTPGPDPTNMAIIGGALVDRETLRDLTEAVRDLTGTLQAGITAGDWRSRNQLAEQIRELAERMDHRRRP